MTRNLHMTHTYKTQMLHESHIFKLWTEQKNTLLKIYRTKRRNMFNHLSSKSQKCVRPMSRVARKPHFTFFFRNLFECVQYTWVTYSHFNREDINKSLLIQNNLQLDKNTPLTFKLKLEKSNYTCLTKFNWNIIDVILVFRD